MRRFGKGTRLAWGARLTAARENVRLAVAVEAAEAIRETREIAGALVWNRAGRMSIVRVVQDGEARSLRVQVEQGAAVRVTVARGRWLPGLRDALLGAMGLGADSLRSPTRGGG